MPGPVLISDAEVSGLIKRLYDELDVDFFPMAFALLAQLEKSGPGGPYNMEWGGEGVRYNAVLGIPGGGTYSSVGNLPPDHARKEDQGVIDVARFYVRRQIDGKIIAGTKSKKMAYRTIGEKVKREVTGAYKRGMQISAHGTSDNIRALVTNVTDTTHIDIQSPYGIAGAGQGGLLLAVGEQIAVLNNATNAIRGISKITSITHNGDTATLVLATAIAAMANTDKVVLAATATDSEFQSGINGLPQITNRGNAYASLHGLSTATYPETAPIRLTVAGGDTELADAPTENDIWTLIRKVAGASGFDANENPDQFFIVTTPGLQKKLAVSFYGQRNYAMAKRVTLRGGFSAIEVCGVAIIADQWCPAGTLYLIHRPSMTWVDSVDFSAVQYEGPAWRWMNDRDAWETSKKRYLNLAAPQRNAQSSISGWTDTERYTHIHAA